MINTAELNSLRDAAMHCMLDECQLGVPTRPSGGDPTAVTWTWGSNVACGINSSASRETFDGSQSTITDAVMRIALDVTVTPDMRVRVTRRAGLPVTPDYYAVMGEPRRGLSAQQVYLRRITGETVL